MHPPQAAIERLLAASLLARVAFHGQADISGLLEADDRKFKEVPARTPSCLAVAVLDTRCCARAAMLFGHAVDHPPPYCPHLDLCP